MKRSDIIRCFINYLKTKHIPSLFRTRIHIYPSYKSWINIHVNNNKYIDVKNASYEFYKTVYTFNANF